MQSKTIKNPSAVIFENYMRKRERAHRGRERRRLTVPLRAAAAALCDGTLGTRAI